MKSKEEKKSWWFGVYAGAGLCIVVAEIKNLLIFGSSFLSIFFLIYGIVIFIFGVTKFKKWNNIY